MTEGDPMTEEDSVTEEDSMTEEGEHDRRGEHGGGRAYCTLENPYARFACIRGESSLC